MKKMIVVVLSIALFNAGCASIMGGGGPQKISLNSTPSGAVVTIRGNELSVVTPGTIKLSTKTPLYVLRFEKEGYESVEVTLVQSQNGWVWGNILIGGLIGLVIDFSTGAAYKLTPQEVNVALQEAQHANADSQWRDKLLVYVDATNK